MNHTIMVHVALRVLLIVLVVQILHNAMNARMGITVVNSLTKKLTTITKIAAIIVKINANHVPHTTHVALV